VVIGPVGVVKGDVVVRSCTVVGSDVVHGSAAQTCWVPSPAGCAWAGAVGGASAFRVTRRAKPQP
jgi:hypothetical protein